MNPTNPDSSAPRRSPWRWVFLGAALLMTPLVVLGLGVWSVMTLDSNAASLRREITRTADARWATKVQFNANWAVMQVIRGASWFIPAKQHGDEARLALAAVHRASVGVYERVGAADGDSFSTALQRTDALMRKRGLVRLLSVRDDHSQVLGYVSDDADRSGRVDFCLAVMDGRDLVVVSTRVDADALGSLVDRCVEQEGVGAKLKLAKLRI